MFAPRTRAIRVCSSEAVLKKSSRRIGAAGCLGWEGEEREGGEGEEVFFEKPHSFD
jgi:hypothetical protein